MVKVNKQVRRPRKASSALARVKSLGTEDKYLRVSLYGRSGTGKTTFWGTFPGKILAMICSGGTKPGELRSIDTPENRDRIFQVVLRSTADFDELVDYQRENAEWDTLVLDQATGLQDLHLKELLSLEDTPVQMSWGLATQQQYGQLANQMKERFRKLLSLDCNVVVVSHEREFGNMEGADVGGLIVPYVSTALTPSVAGWLAGATDYICQTFIRQKVVQKKRKFQGKIKTSEVVTKEIEYCLRTGPDPVYVTKFRMPKANQPPQVIVDPSYEKLIKVIRGK